MSSLAPSCGFVYVATGAGYVEEAAQSARSLRLHHPNHPICLFTDRAVASNSPFDHVYVRSDVVRKPIDKLLAIHCPFERAIFLDSDTHVFGDLTPIFEVLERFDFAALQDVNRGWDYELPGVPLCFTEFNTGVLAFRKTDAVDQFFARWRRDYEMLQQKQPHLNVHADQPAFRLALYHSELRVAPLPSEFHFLANFPNAALWRVRLIHGRGDYQRMERDVNQSLGPRAYIPEVGVVQRFGGRKVWLQATTRLLRRMLRLVIAPPVDPAAANPGKWWRQENTPQSPDRKP